MTVRVNVLGDHCIVKCFSDEILGLALYFQSMHSGIQCFLEGAPPNLNFHTAALYFAVIQDIIHDRQKQVATRDNHFQGFIFEGIEFCILPQTGKPNDAIKGSLNLMTYTQSAAIVRQML